MKQDFDMAMKDYQPSEEFLAMKKEAEGENIVVKNKIGERGALTEAYFNFVTNSWLNAARHVAKNSSNFGPLDVEDQLHKMWEINCQNQQSEDKVNQQHKSTSKTKKKSSKKEKDPNAPKKPFSAYMIYCNSNRETMKKDFPNMSNNELFTALGNCWKQLGNEERAQYVEKATADRDRYDREYKEYIENIPDKKEDIEIADGGCGVLE